MTRVAQLEHLIAKALKAVEKKLDDGEASAGTLANVLPKLRAELDEERQRAGLAEGDNLTVEFVLPEPRE